MTLTESLAMLPAASVAGFYLAHPDATYFNVGRIGPDQLKSWAERNASSVDARRAGARAAALSRPPANAGSSVDATTEAGRVDAAGMRLLTTARKRLPNSQNASLHRRFVDACTPPRGLRKRSTLTTNSRRPECAPLAGMRSAFARRLARISSRPCGDRQWTNGSEIEVGARAHRPLRPRRARGGASSLVVAACGGGKDGAEPARPIRRGGARPRRRRATVVDDADQDRGVALPGPGDHGPDRGRDRSPADDARTRPGSTSSSPSRRRCIASTSTRRGRCRRRRRADQRGQLLRLVVEPGARRRRPAAPARRVRAVRDLRRSRSPTRPCRAQPRGVASYYDMLGEKAFGNFRDLLEGVTYHPMMGIYLSHLKNQKEDPDDRPRPRPQLRARDHAAVHDRPVQAQRRRHRR